MKAALVLLAVLSSTAQADSFIDWEKHVYDEEEYFKGIPDQFDVEEARFYFKVIHWFLTGVERGLYNNKDATINSDCFGDQYVRKLNEYFYLFNVNPFGDFFENIFPEISLTY
jgi:hypothetical protein